MKHWNFKIWRILITDGGASDIQGQELVIVERLSPRCKQCKLASCYYEWRTKMHAKLAGELGIEYLWSSNDTLMLV